MARPPFRKDRGRLLDRPAEAVLLMLPIERTVVPHVIAEQTLATLPRDASVREAAAMMAARRIGAVLVVDGGRLVGIFTERDAITRVVARGTDPDRTPIATVMTPDPDTIRPDASAAAALERMSS